jgi:hypothetical protein
MSNSAFKKIRSLELEIEREQLDLIFDILLDFNNLEKLSVKVVHYEPTTPTKNLIKLI